MIELPFWGWILVGMASGLVIFPIGIGIYSLIKNTLERRKIKREIKKGNFMQPLDKNDYNHKMWAKEIDVEANQKRLETLEKDIFKGKQKPHLEANDVPEENKDKKDD